MSKDLLSALNKPIDNKTSMVSKKVDTSCKSSVNEVTDFLSEKIPNREDDELQQDIINDMLTNVSNEIVLVGNKLCVANEPNIPHCDISLDNSSVVEGEMVSFKRVKFSPWVSFNKDSLTVKKKHLNDTNGINVDRCDFILISESSDEETETLRNNYSEFSKVNQSVVQSEKDINIKNCKVVIENFVPFMLNSVGNNVSLNNSKDTNKKTSVRKESPDSTVCLVNSFRINGKTKIEDNTRIKNIDNKINSISTFLKQRAVECKEALNNFEGFTEQDILILTVKLALFKMNSYKYSKSLSPCSLYTLDGKQILIKDVSQKERLTARPSCKKKSSKALVSSSVQTEYEVLPVTPGPSTSRIRPVSLAKLHWLEREIANEKFMKNDVLDTREPLTPGTPVEQEAVSSTFPLNTPVEKLKPVSRRQLTFTSPSSEPLENDVLASSSNAVQRGSNCSSNDDWQVLHNRMQYMIPNCREDIHHNDFEHSGVRPTRLTFTTCGLNSKETALITKLAQMTKSCLTKDFTHETTHLVIGATGRGTLEYYLAIAYRAFIVTMEWVTLCLALNKILPVTGFIPTDDEGPLKCLEPISPPFVGFHTSLKILGNASNYPIAEITKTLLSLGGARLLADIDAFLTLQEGSFPRFFVYGTASQITQAVIDKCASFHIVPVQFMWVYDSISAFRALPVMDYLGTAIHSRTLIRDYKIPEQLACSRYPRLEGLCQRGSFMSSFSGELSELKDYLYRK